MSKNKQTKPPANLSVEELKAQAVAAELEKANMGPEEITELPDDIPEAVYNKAKAKHGHVFIVSCEDLGGEMRYALMQPWNTVAANDMFKAEEDKNMINAAASMVHELMICGCEDFKKDPAMMLQAFRQMAPLMRRNAGRLKKLSPKPK